MRRPLIAAVACCLVVAGCALDLGQSVRFGNYGGKQPEPKPEAPFDVMFIKGGNTRWFPAHIRWAPDDSHLLVSLCHTVRNEYCRIGKYWIAERRWELLDLQPQTTYRWPAYSPDGKRIVATVATCDDQYHCHGPDDTLTVLSADGKQAEKVIRSYAQYPSFSGDGRKIIYWRLTGGGGGEVAMFDLDTRKEEKLTDVRFEFRTRGVYFLPGDNRFLFSGYIPEPLFWASTKVVNGEVRTEYGIDEKGGKSYVRPLTGTKLDREGPNARVRRFVADRRHGLMTRGTLERLELLWPDNGASANNDGADDVNRKGEVLYSCPPGRCLKRMLAEGRYRIRGIDPAHPPKPAVSGQKQTVFALREAHEDASDVSVFVVNASAQEAAISNDGRRVAFCLGDYSWEQFGISTLGDPSAEFIDWPRLDLDPAATQRLVTKTGKE